ncbi:MAG: hypothetical protein WBL63_08005 [Candidatus Acidiferrum sp.]
MISPARLIQFTVELIFVLLGALVVWLGLNGRIYFDRRSIPWLVISVGVIAWGVLAVAKPGLWSARWQKRNRGGSMILLGILMLTIARLPFIWVGKVLAVCGLLLIFRGVVGSLLILKQR